MKKTILFFVLFFALLIGQAQNQISELSKSLVFSTGLDEWGNYYDKVSGVRGTPTDTYFCLGKGGEGRRWLENINTSYSSLADDARYDFGTGDFTLIASFTPANITDNGKYLISKEAGGIGCGLYQEDNDIWIRFDDGTTDVSAIIGTDILVAWTKITCEVVFTRSGNAALYLNGSASSSGTVVISTASLTLDNTGAFVVGNIEAHNQGFTGQIHFTRAFNFALTTDIAYYSKPENPIKWVDRGATGVIMNTSNCSNSSYSVYRFETFSDVSSSGFTAIGTNTSYNVCGTADEIGLVAGKAYIANYTFTNNGGGVPLQALFSDLQLGGGEANETVVVVGNNSFRGVAGSTRTGVFGWDQHLQAMNFTISNLIVKQAGCVLDLNTEGLAQSTSGYWYDNTNSLTATNSGTTLIIPPASNLKATYFNGTTGKVVYTGMNGLTGITTISAQITPLALGGYIFDNTKVRLKVNSSGYLSFSRDGTTFINSGAASIAINTTYNILVASTSAGVTNFYINGVLSGTANQAAGTPASGTTWNIGTDATTFYTGTMSDLYINGELLDLDRIKLLNDIH